MLNTTLARLRCPGKLRKPGCAGMLNLLPKEKITDGFNSGVFEVRSGNLVCQKCQSRFPILAGVAILVQDIGFYLLSHVKGVSKLVADQEIPREFLQDYLEAKSEIELEHIEEDLEADRVNALYLMNHYLRVGSVDSQNEWWKPKGSPGSPLLDTLIREYWDHGPFAQVRKWVEEHHRSSDSPLNLIELGCGVGGLSRELKPFLKSYLGVDGSFASIAIARHLALGVAYSGNLGIPEDLIRGPVSRKVGIPQDSSPDGWVDFVVGDFENPPVEKNAWEITVALNAIDMLDDPSLLPKLQWELLNKRGALIHSCPYIWHEKVARKLRKQLPKGNLDSARAGEWLYEQEGFVIQERIEHLPWLFLKHSRQLEIYSSHLFFAKKGERVTF